MQTTIEAGTVNKVAEIKRQAKALGAVGTTVSGTWTTAKNITNGKKRKIEGGFTADGTNVVELKNQWTMLEGAEGSMIAVRLLEGEDVKVTLEHPEPVAPTETESKGDGAAASEDDEEEDGDDEEE